jgi:predicted ABC-type ATPase
MEHKRLTLFAGHYGSGKTNIAVNYALLLASEGKKVCIADLDIVNPYFRTKDSAAVLEAAGVDLISPQYANTNVDLPALPAASYRLVQDRSSYGIMDIGGDDRGAYALGRFVPSILEENDYRMIFVANASRPLTRTPEDAMEVMAEIEAACGLKFTDLINNTNLGSETTAETVLAAENYMQELSRLSGLPIFATTATEAVAAELNGRIENVLPMKLQEKYFDLPSQKPGNRPLWG